MPVLRALLFLACPLILHSVSESPATECSFVNGDGSGGSEVKIGDHTGTRCIEECIQRRKTDTTINGVTIKQDHSGGCWCERNMNHVTKSMTYKTCFLNLIG